MPSGSRSPEIEHLDLLRTARAVQSAAARDDVDAVHEELCRFRNSLVVHLQHHHEREQHGATNDLHARLTRHGHERLLAFLDRLLAETADDEPGRCSCVVRTAELRAMLLRQVRLEAGSRLAHP